MFHFNFDLSFAIFEATGEDDLLQQALALSLSQQDDKSRVSRPPDFNAMTEEEQLHYALQMSMAQSASTSDTATEKSPVNDAEMKDEDEDYAKAMNDPEFLQRVISSLPGVDPNSEAVRSAFENIAKEDKSKDQQKEKQPKDKDEKK